MRPRLPGEALGALIPVQTALRAQAQAAADTVLAEAHRDAEQVRAEARRHAMEILAAGRAEGEQEAAAAVAARLIKRRREAQAVILAARRALYDELRRRCREAARTLSEDPEYPILQQQLTKHAMVRLGTTASVRESAEGGVVAVDGSRRLDLSLPALADHELDRLGGEVEGMWTM
jgi:vacuolar-type H+-ATPase subunit E/Vma4